MLKKSEVIVVLGVILILVYVVYAQETTTTETTTTTTGTTEFVNHGVTPDSFYYTFDLLAEDVALALTASPENKAGLTSDFLAERLAETHQMIQEDNYEDAQVSVDEGVELLAETHNYVEEVGEDEFIEVEELEQETTVFDDLIELELHAIQNDEYAEAIKTELVTQVETGEITEETASSLNIDLLREEIVEIENSIIEQKEELEDSVALENEVTELEVELIVDEHEEELGLTDLHKEEINEELAAAKEALQEIEEDFEKEKLEAEQAGLEIPHEEAIDKLLEQAKLKLQICENAFLHEQYGRAFGQFTAAEHLILNADKLLAIETLSPEEKARIEAELTEFEIDPEQIRRKIEEENKKFTDDYEQIKEELKRKYPDRADEFEKMYEQSKKVVELATKLSEEYSREFERFRAQGLSEEEATTILTERFSDEFRKAYGEPFIPPGFEGIHFEEIPGILPLAAEQPKVSVGVIEDYTYIDPITNYKYEFTPDGYKYTTPSGFTYKQKYSEGFTLPKVFQEGNEVHTYEKELPDGTYEYKYYPTGYEIIKPDGEFEKHSYPEGEYTIHGGGKFVYKPTGFEYHPFEITDAGVKNYEYNPEFNTYTSSTGETYTPPEGLSYHEDIKYEEGKKHYTYESHEGVAWTYKPATNTWTSSSGETYTPSTSTVAPVGHEEQRSYTTKSGETWAYDSSSGTWKSSSGESYSTTTGEHTTSEGETWNYDASSNTWTSSSGESTGGHTGDSGGYSGGDSGGHSEGSPTGHSVYDVKKYRRF